MGFQSAYEAPCTNLHGYIVQCREQQLEVTVLAISKPILWINRGP